MRARAKVERVMRRAIRTTIIGAISLPVTARVGAQQVSGTVSDSVSRLRIAGAVIQATNGAGTVVARAISNERGEYRLVGSADAVGLRVVRLGFRPRELPLPTPLPETLTRDVGMLRVPSMLESVRVTDNARCPRRRDRAAALGLWEQARAGLLSTIVAREQNRGSAEILVYERVFDGNTDNVVRLGVSGGVSEQAGKAFGAALTAAEFVRTGFSRDSAGTAVYFGPDAEILLSEGFADAYCFHLADPVASRPNQVGLAFANLDRRRGRIDIEGSLWIDTVSRSLREIEYRYVGLPSVTADFNPGGRIHFEQVATDVAMIDRWNLRLVGSNGDADALLAVPPALQRTEIRRHLFASESGGEVARITWPDGRRWEARLGRAIVRVVDADGRPMSSLELELPGTHYRATTDSSGVARFADLIPGPYRVALLDPRMARLGLSLESSLRFVAQRDSVLRLDLRAPTLEEFTRKRCIEARQYSPRDSSFILGRVMSGDGRAIKDVTVSFSVRQSGDWSPLIGNYTTGTDGIFQSCSSLLKPGRLVRITVSWQGELVAELTRQLESSPLVVPIVPGERKP